MIAVRGLRKAFDDDGRGGQRAVDGVDLGVEEGAIYVLLGPSGCGKTTLLRCIAGVEVPDDGEIALGGEVVYSSAGRIMVPCQRRDIGLVFQSYALWPHMSVWENVAYPLRYGSRSRLRDAEIRRRVAEALQTVGLEDLGHRPATDLSGGQQQRVALARAVVHRPRVLLMDEPLSNLDARLRALMRKQLAGLLRRLGMTTLYVTHDQVEAFSLADVVGVMRGGRILEEGKPRDVYRAPRDRFTAGFMSDVNWLEGIVEEVGSELAVVRAEIGAVSVRKGAVAAPVGAKVELGIRSSDLRPGPAEGAGPSVNRFRGRVASVQFGGEWSRLEVDVHGYLAEVVIFDRQSVLTVGSETCLHVAADEILVYTRSEERG